MKVDWVKCAAITFELSVLASMIAVMTLAPGPLRLSLGAYALGYIIKTTIDSILDWWNL